MNRIVTIVFLSVILLTSLVTIVSAKDLTATANRLATKHAREFLSNQGSVEVDEDQFKGAVSVTDPNKVKTQLSDIKVVGQTVKFNAVIRLPLSVKGQAKFGNEFRDVDVQLTVNSKVEGSVELKQDPERISFVTKCKLKELKCEVTKLVKPSRGASSISKLVNFELANQLNKIQTALTKFLEQQKTGIAVSQLKQTLQKELRTSLAKYNSKSSPLAKESHRKKHVEWLKFKVFGKKVKTKIAEWTDKIDATIWLNDPNKNLNVKITKLQLVGGKISFEASASAAITGDARVGISKVTTSTKAKGKVSVLVAGSAVLNEGGLGSAEITRLNANVDKVSFSNDLVNVFKGTIRKKANEAIDKEEPKWKTKLEKEINGLRI